MDKNTLTNDDKKFLTACVASILLEIKCVKQNKNTINPEPETVKESYIQADQCIRNFLKIGETNTKKY